MHFFFYGHYVFFFFLKLGKKIKIDKKKENTHNQTVRVIRNCVSKTSFNIAIVPHNDRSCYVFYRLFCWVKNKTYLYEARITNKSPSPIGEGRGEELFKGFGGVNP